MHTKNRYALVLVALLAVTGVSCGAKKSGTVDASAPAKVAEKASDGKTAETSTSTSTSTTTSGSTDTTAASGDSSSDTTGALPTDLAGLGDCYQVSLAYASLILEPLGFMGGKATEADLAKFKQQTAELEAKIPEAVRPDFQTVAEAYRQYADAMQSIDFADMMNPDTQQKMEAAAAKLDDPSFKAASDRISQYFAQQCKS